MSTIFDTISINIKFDTRKCLISKEKKLKTLVFSCFASVLLNMPLPAACLLGVRLTAGNGNILNNIYVK